MKSKEEFTKSIDDEISNAVLPSRRRKLRSGEKIDLTSYGIPGMFLSGRGAEVFEYEDGTLVPIIESYGPLLRYAFARLIVESTRPLNKEDVRFIRTHMNATQDEFGQLLGLTRETISRIESGKERVTEATSNNIRYCGIKFLMRGQSAKAFRKKAPGPSQELKLNMGRFASYVEDAINDIPHNTKLEISRC